MSTAYSPAYSPPHYVITVHNHTEEGTKMPMRLKVSLPKCNLSLFSRDVA